MRVISTEKLPIKMWLDYLEDEAEQQAKNLANHPFTFKHVAIMPDAHSGYGMPIGGVLATDGVVIPNAVGADIGCGVAQIELDLHIDDLSEEDTKEIMGRIRKEIPMGFKRHSTAQDWIGFDTAPDIPIIQEQLDSARNQLGTLGGGNHFIEIQKNMSGNIFVMVHSGSRNFGLKVAKTYNDLAMRLNEKWASKIPSKDLAFLPTDTKEGQEYIEAMNFCLDFAHRNRSDMLFIIAEIFEDLLGARVACGIDCHHNYAAIENHFGRNVIVHRKGAIKLRGEGFGLIPGSMGSASYLVQAGDNRESFNSCSHGAGRKMGRRQAKEKLNLGEEQSKMAGIIHGIRNESDLDEAPGAYKDISEVMENQKDLVRIIDEFVPIANLKG